MTWEWSHTNEAYDNAYRNLQQFPLGKLQEIWCEIQTFEHCQTNEDYDNWDDNVYYQQLSKVTDQHDLLVDWIWEWAANWRQCDNGGALLHLCPYNCGCHKVSVDLEKVETNE